MSVFSKSRLFPHPAKQIADAAAAAAEEAAAAAAEEAAVAAAEQAAAVAAAEEAAAAAAEQAAAAAKEAAAVAAAAYANAVANDYSTALRERDIKFEGYSLLEIGPGRNLLHVFALKALGLDIGIADRFLATWEDFDERAATLFFERLWPDSRRTIIDAMSAGGYPFRMYAEPAEDMRSIDASSFDAVFSNATLEHFYDLPAVARELYRVTKLNGLSRHQIDFRDHRDFSRPLEFLLDDDDGFALALKGNRWMQGNRLRPSEVIRVFYEAGFQLLEIHPNTTAEMAYLADFVPRLRAANYTRYAGWPVGDLITTGARFIWRRPL